MHKFPFLEISPLQAGAILALIKRAFLQGALGAFLVSDPWPFRLIAPQQLWIRSDQVQKCHGKVPDGNFGGLGLQPQMAICPTHDAISPVALEIEPISLTL